MELKPRISLTTLLLALAVMSSTLRAGVVSPNGKLVAYTVPAYDEDANLYSEVFVRASDGSSTRTLGKVPGQRDQVRWIGNDRIIVSEFPSADRFGVFDEIGRAHV